MTNKRFISLSLVLCIVTVTNATQQSQINQSILRIIKQAPPTKPVGTHLTAEFWQTQKTITSAQELEKILIASAKHANSTPLKVAIEKFEPQGITGVVIVAESHISVHTWPEENYVAVDAFTCGDNTIPQKAIEYLQKQFKPKMIQIQEIKRGIQSNAKPVPIEQDPKKKERRDVAETTSTIETQDISKDNQVFGQELTLNLKDCDHESISSKEKILEFVDKLCSLIDMKKFGKPFIEHFAKHSEIAAGYSVAQMIETSLISGHFSEFWDNAYLNIFSCKPFDAQIARNFAKEFFGAKSLEARLTIR